MRVNKRVHRVCLHPFPPADRVPLPAGERLASNAKYSTRHRDEGPVNGELAREQGHRFGWPLRRRFTCDRYAAVRGKTSFSCFKSRGYGVLTHVLQPSLQRGYIDVEISSDLFQRHTVATVTGDRDDIFTELLGKRFGHDEIFPANTRRAPTISCH